MKIGEFARLSNATIRTLHYYDDLGLLKPDSIDRYTGYRFYSITKLKQMRQIQTMKEIGFTLIEIKSFLALDQADENVRSEFIASKKQDIELEIANGKRRLNMLDEFIYKLKEGDDMGSMDFTDDIELIEHKRFMREAVGRAYGDIKTPPKFVKVYAGGSRFGAIDDTGRVYMWGDNTTGGCDIPDDLPPIAELGIGCCHTVALDENGKLYGWGSSEYGELDFLYAEDLPKIISVKADNYKTTALSEDGRVFSWGSTGNQCGQRFVPLNLRGVRQIAINAYVTAALTDEGKIIQWGFWQELPDIDAEISEISVAGNHVVILGGDGNIYGDIPHKIMNIYYRQKPSISGIKKLIAGANCIAAISNVGKIYIWGHYEPLMDGSSVMNVPLNLPPVVDAAIGSNDIVCIGADGRLYAWGIADMIVPRALDGFDGKPEFAPSYYTADINEPRDVYTYEGLCKAVQERIRNITVKADMTVTGMRLEITDKITLTVDSGVTLTIASINVLIHGRLINNGIIKGDSCQTARIITDNPIEGSGSFISGFNGRLIDCSMLFGLNIEYRGKTADDINRFLTEDSIYNIITYDNIETLVIDKDTVIPQSKKVQLYNQGQLQINERATLTVLGYFITSKEPVIKGRLIGNVEGYGTYIYSTEQFYETVAFNAKIGTRITDRIIKIKADITVKDICWVNMGYYTRLFIDEGVTLTIDSLDFTLLGEITNNGAIKGVGCINVNHPIKGNGKVSGVKVCLYDGDIEYLTEDSIYSTIYCTNADQINSKAVPCAGIHYPHYSQSVYQPINNGSFYNIHNDTVIPDSKLVWIHPDCTLKVKEGATLRIDGKLETTNEPIIEGNIIGDITLIDRNKPVDVYTLEELWKAASNQIKQVTVKADITVKNTTFYALYLLGTLIIDEGVTLNCDSCTLHIGKLVNKGLIKGTGNISCNGIINGDIITGGFHQILVTVSNMEDIRKCIAEDSIYTGVNYYNNNREEVLTLDSDLIIPKDKTLILSPSITLRIGKDAVLVINGEFKAHEEPIVEGVILGEYEILRPYVKNGQ